MKIKYLIIILLFTTIIFALGFTSPIFLWSMQEYIASPLTSCEGIEEYYTGLSFSFDLKNMERKYLLCYNGDESLDFFKSPSDICKTDGYDCEDFSKAVMCLCDLYDKICRYYSYSEFPPDEITDIFSAHSGVNL